MHFPIVITRLITDYLILDNVSYPLWEKICKLKLRNANEQKVLMSVRTDTHAMAALLENEELICLPLLCDNSAPWVSHVMLKHQIVNWDMIVTKPHDWVFDIIDAMPKKVESMCLNPAPWVCRVLSKHPHLINYDELSQNPALWAREYVEYTGPDCFEKKMSYRCGAMHYGDMPDVSDILFEHPHRINWNDLALRHESWVGKMFIRCPNKITKALSKHPAEWVKTVLLRHKRKINWLNLHKNTAYWAWDMILADPSKINWTVLHDDSKDRTYAFMKKHINRVKWRSVYKHHGSWIPRLLIENPDRINWDLLHACKMEWAGKVLIRFPHKIDTDLLAQNEACWIMKLHYVTLPHYPNISSTASIPKDLYVESNIVNPFTGVSIRLPRTWDWRIYFPPGDRERCIFRDLRLHINKKNAQWLMMNRSPWVGEFLMENPDLVTLEIYSNPAYWVGDLLLKNPQLIYDNIYWVEHEWVYHVMNKRPDLLVNWTPRKTVRSCIFLREKKYNITCEKWAQHKWNKVHVAQIMQSLAW